MKPSFLGVVVIIGAIAFASLVLADREIQAGVRRLSNYTFSPPSALDGDPGNPVQPAN